MRRTVHAHEQGCLALLCGLSSQEFQIADLFGPDFLPPFFYGYWVRGKCVASNGRQCELLFSWFQDVFFLTASLCSGYFGLCTPSSLPEQKGYSKTKEQGRPTHTKPELPRFFDIWRHRISCKPHTAFCSYLNNMSCALFRNSTPPLTRRR